MKKRYPILTVVSLGLALLLAACGGGGGGSSVDGYDTDRWMNAGTSVPTAEAVLPTSPSFGSNVAVHDPSVFYDEKTETYYAFGTHFAVASSKDLISWTQVATDGMDTALFGSGGVNRVLEKMVAELGATSKLDLWAPDVMKIGGKYFMYVSATEGFGSSHSMIVRVSANDVMGPYDEEEVIVVSHGENGAPNAIDPELFYDKEGTLWMVYGSFFGGVFIKQLDKKGLPVEDGYGTLLWKGDSRGVEGPFIFYNAETDYYYLMTSDGSLSSDYCMRVARSKTPNGPYSDISGADPASKTRSGVKLAGNYQFAGDTGYAALGHNSVIKVDGRYLVVHHVRQEQGNGGVTGGHHVEVRQLYFNEAGWPVLSPDRYAGEKAGTVTQEKVAGDYDVIVHTIDTDITFKRSQKYTLSADGKIVSGDKEAGIWTVKSGYYVEITLDGTIYRGVVAPAWRTYGTPAGIYCMTAVSDLGGSIWLNAAP